MDPFEVRMQFLTLLKRLDASQQSIRKVVGYALKYFSRCGEDLWDCILEECQKGSINNRINILYFLDSLCETTLVTKSQLNHPSSQLSSNQSSYVDYVTRDLNKIIESVVPEGRQGLPNLMSARQILDNWRSKRVIDPQKVEEVMSVLDNRKDTLESESDPKSSSAALPRNEVFKRIEEDRERHKRLRERRWVQPVSHNQTTPQTLAAFLPLTDEDDGQGELTLDIEFENDWETTSDWNEDDDDAAQEENELCFPPSTEERSIPMDLD
ncbi:hypothetical protein K474DRAFT_1631966 [Panus rudis PR-1116 ss-1]|nr:hypothetical protein K474DRAFT_1631966 [Panus rudis PR-1116 ss-1]